MGLAELIGIIGGTTAALGGGGALLVAGHRAAVKLHDVHIAIMGEDARMVAGIQLPAVPSLGTRVAGIEAELHPNSGSSLRDAVDRLEAGLAAHATDPDAHLKH